MSSAPTLLSVFSGAGGLDLGLEAAGFRNVGCLELDEHARASLQANRPGWSIIDPPDVVEAATMLSPRKLSLRKRELTMLAGGPPCQPFSKAAQWSAKSKKGVQDPRSKCLASFMELVAKFLPRVVLIENVQGFVSGRGNAVGLIRRALTSINQDHQTSYRLQFSVLNAAHFGVPQRRSRAILFAERNGTSMPLLARTHEADPITSWDAIGGVYTPTTTALRQKWLKLLPTIPEGQNYLWHTPRGGGRPLFGYRSKYWSFLLKLAKDQPSWTLPAQPGPYAGPFHWDNRPLTVEEMLRLQTFPSHWKVCGPAREQIRQIGNATPPLLAELIGRAVSVTILKSAVGHEPLWMIRRSALPPPPAVAPTPIPQEFAKLEGAWPDHPGTGRGPCPVRTVEKSDGQRSQKITLRKRQRQKNGGRAVRSKTNRTRRAAA